MSITSFRYGFIRIKTMGDGFYVNCPRSFFASLVRRLVEVRNAVSGVLFTAFRRRYSQND